MPIEACSQAEFLTERGFFPDVDTALAAIVQMDANILKVMMNIAADDSSDVPFGDSLGIELD